MAEPCLCGQATASPTCTVTAGPGITVAGNLITATSANPWTSFVPATTNFTLGNALNDSRYLLSGKTLDVVWAIRFGTTSTYTANPWMWGLPAGAAPFFGANTISLNHVFGLASIRDISAADPWFSGEVILNANANPAQIRYGDDAGGVNTVVTQGTPITFTTGDEIVMRARFEVV